MGFGESGRSRDSKVKKSQYWIEKILIYSIGCRKEGGGNDVTLAGRGQRCGDEG